MKNSSPFTLSELVAGGTQGVLSQELTTYIKDGSSIKKVVVKRCFHDDGDYTDEMTTTVLYADATYVS